MRRGLAFVVGLATVSPALAQFASNREPTPQPAPVIQPMPPTGFTPQPQVQPQPAPVTQPIQRVSATTEQPTNAPHPWAVKPEHGPWMVCIKSYRDDAATGTSARKSAEELANEIRTGQKAAAFLYEWGAEERKKEFARREAYRDKVRKEYAPFLELQEQMKKKAETQGSEFINAPPTVRIPTVEYTEQYAVLVGGFKDMETARRALDTIRKWTPPKGKDHLFDRAVISRPGEKGSEMEGTFLNPYTTAMVVPNPTVRQTDPTAPPPVDPLLAKLNENEEFSLLKNPKPVTLCVKVFSVPTRTQPKDDDTSVIGKMFSSKNAKMLDATALQAHELAAALRDKTMKPHPFDAYVLHARTGSLVCIGGFDAADDKQISVVGREIQSITFQELNKNKMPTGNVLRMFDHVFVMSIPRVN